MNVPPAMFSPAVHVSWMWSVRQSGLLFRRNVTSSRTAEVEREALARDIEYRAAELRSFAEAVSHELRQPIRNIDGLYAPHHAVGKAWMCCTAKSDPRREQPTAFSRFAHLKARFGYGHAGLHEPRTGGGAHGRCYDAQRCV